MGIPFSLLFSYPHSIQFGPGTVVIPLVLEICFFTYENTQTNLGIYEVNGGYIYIYLYMHFIEIIKNGERKRHSLINVVKG